MEEAAGAGVTRGGKEKKRQVSVVHCLRILYAYKRCFNTKRTKFYGVPPKTQLFKSASGFLFLYTLYNVFHVTTIKYGLPTIFEHPECFEMLQI